MTYDFTYKDNEGDTYQSDQHTTLSGAKAEWEKIKEFHDGDCHIDETWIYDDNGNFKGRWR